MKNIKKSKNKINFGVIILSAFIIKGGSIAIEHATTNHTKEICPVTTVLLNNGLQDLAERHQSNNIKETYAKQGVDAFAKLDNNGFTIINQKTPYWYESFDYIEIPSQKSR